MSAFRKTNRAAYENFLRAKCEAYTGASTVRSYPYYLLVDPADVCQLRCTTCPTGIENENHRTGGSEILFRRNRSVMKPALFDALLDEVGPYLFFLMLYNWGEPLLNKSIHEFVKKAHAYDIETEIHTNLSIPLSERRIEELLSSGLDTLTGSIDGFSQEVYQIHRVGGDIELIKKNLEALARTRERLGLKTRINYKMLVFRHNEHEIPAARRYCEGIGIEFSAEDAAVPDESWMPSQRRKELPKSFESIPEGGLPPVPESSPSAEQPRDRESALGEANKQAPAAEEIDLRLEQERLDVLYPTKGGKKDEYPQFCSWHYGFSVVTAGGPVAPCCSTANESADFGRVSPGETSFADVWNNERYRHARGVMAGSDLSDTAGVKTICEPCRFPRLVQQLYSLFDLKVVAAFYRQLDDGSDPTLEAGFRLLSETRYELSTCELIRRGVFNPMMMLEAGNGDERDMSAFIRFHEEHLANAPGALDASG